MTPATSSAIQPLADDALAGGAFSHRTYLLRRKVFTLLHGAFHLYDANGAIALYMRKKAFKLKEDLRIFTGEDMKTEVLAIRARQILDFGATYDVFDSRAGGQKVGALRRKGFKSLLKDEWVILDAEDREIGKIEEESMVLALMRRLLTPLIPQTFNGTVGAARVLTFRQRFNPFISKLELDFTPDAGGQLDRRLGVAAALLLSAIEGRQQG